MSKANKSLTKAMIFADKTVRASLDATYAIEELCGHVDALSDQNAFLLGQMNRLKKELGSQKEAYEKLTGKKMKKMGVER